MDDPGRITSLLDDIRRGDPGATDRLLPLVYDQLRGLARTVFSDHEQGSTLQPTAVVHEAWLKISPHVGSLECRRHFFAVAARAMREVLADHAKAARREKRGGGTPTIALVDGDASARPPAVDLVALHESLEKLAALNARHAQVVELRLLGALTEAEIAETLDISPRTVRSDWSTARAWLWHELVED